MIKKLRFLAVSVLFAGSCYGGTLTGSVRNGTKGNMVSAQTVVLIKLAGGMEELDSTKTDAQGRFKFDRPEIGQQPFLIRVNYNGVNYHANVPPTVANADVEVFEPTATVADLHITSRAVIVQPDGANLLVGEEYEVTNISKPAVTFNKEFEFALPEGAEIGQVSAWGASGMPTVQGTVNKGKNRFGLVFPLRPGKNGIRLSYQMPYSSQQAVVGAASPYAVETAMVVAPPTMQISGEGLQSAGQREGWNVFARASVPASAPLDIKVSGTAPPPATGSPTGGAEEAAAGPQAGEARTMPGRIDDLKWVLTGGFAALFTLGAIYLWRRPLQPAVAPHRQPAAAVAANPAPAVAAPASQAVAQADHHVKQSLDELKDSLFRLELRRQAGTISEDDYARERSRTEQIIRELVRG